MHLKLSLSANFVSLCRAVAVGLCVLVAGCSGGNNRSDSSARADTQQNASIVDLQQRVLSLEKQLGETTAARERTSVQKLPNSSRAQNLQPAVPGNRHYLVRGNNRALYTDKDRCEEARSTLLRAYADAADGQVEQVQSQPDLRCVPAQ
jgi:hypothetical protein